MESEGSIPQSHNLTPTPYRDIFNPYHALRHVYLGYIYIYNFFFN